MPTFLVPPRPTRPTPTGSAAQVLEHTLDLLATPDAWCKQSMEEDGYRPYREGVLGMGMPGEFAQQVTQRCLVGAARRALQRTGHYLAEVEIFGPIMFADDVARQVMAHLAAAVTDRHPWAALGGCDCQACANAASVLPGEMTVARWNDSPATTHDQVLEVLKDARQRALDAELARP